MKYFTSYVMIFFTKLSISDIIYENLFCNWERLLLSDENLCLETDLGPGAYAYFPKQVPVRRIYEEKEQEILSDKDRVPRSSAEGRQWAHQKRKRTRRRRSFCPSPM